jgi:hypothetical protein
MTEEASCCAPADAGKNSCKVEAVVSVDERGQMVLLKSCATVPTYEQGTSWRPSAASETARSAASL